MIILNSYVCLVESLHDLLSIKLGRSKKVCGQKTWVYFTEYRNIHINRNEKP